jgi:hypothetical protein
MPQKARKPVPRKIVLRLPDLDHAKSSVLNSLSPRLLNDNKVLSSNSNNPFILCNETSSKVFGVDQDTSGCTQSIGMAWRGGICHS